MSTVCIIPARGGSTRIPGKNKRMFHGKPIITYSIEAAQSMSDDCKIDHVVVSTDDGEIAKIAEQHGAIVQWREEWYARDEVGTQQVANYVLARLGASNNDFAVVLYATAPLLDRHDLWQGMVTAKRRECSFSMSVGTNPLRDAGQFYCGQVISFYRSDLISPCTCMIPIDESRVCDINTEEDWLRAEQMYLALKEKQ